MNSVNRLLQRLPGAGIVLAILVGFGVCAPAADSVPRVRQRFVPFERPELWPDAATTDWVPVKRSELADLLQRIRRGHSGSLTIPFSRANYSATFDPTTLQLTNGLASIDCADDLDVGRLVPFGPLNLSVSDPRWKNSSERAVLGATDTGQHYLVVGENHSLQFAWQLDGRQRLSGAEFRLQVPASVASTLDLQLPEDWTLTSSVGTVIRGDTDRGSATWRINLGSRSAARLRLIAPDSPGGQDRQTPSTARLNSRFDVTPLAVEATVEVKLETVRERADSVELELADNWQVRAIERTAGGSVEWQDLGAADGRRRLTIKLPEAPGTAEQEFVVKASKPLQPGGVVQLRAPRLINTVLLGDRFSVSLRSPYALRDYSVAGLRQTDVSVEAGDTGLTLLTFQQFLPEAGIRLNLTDDQSDRARFVSIREFSVGRFDLDPPELHADLQLTSRSRDVFSLDLFVPEGWELTRVVQRVAAGLQVDLPWRVIERDVEQAKRVRLSLPDGLETGRPALIQISAQRAQWSHDGTASAPAVFPDAYTLTSITAAVISGARGDPDSHRVESFTPVEWADIATMSDWTRLVSDSLEFNGSLHTLSYWEDAAHLARSQAYGLSDRTDNSSHAVQTTAATQQNEPAAQVSAEQVEEPDIAPENNNGTLRTDRPIVVSRLESFVSPGATSRDFHRMSWRFAYPFTARNLSLRLPKQAVLLEVQWNGEPLGVTTDTDHWMVPVPDTVAGDTLTVSYTLPSENVYLRETYSFGAASIEAIDASFEWILYLRKGFAAVSLTREMTRLGVSRSRSWLRWFFGPLARSSTQDWFNPLSPDAWRHAWQTNERLLDASAEPANFEDSAPLHGNATPTEWNVIRATSGAVPGTLTIHVCRVDRLNALGWFVLVTTCLVGALLRSLSVSSRNRIGLIWLSGCMAAAMLVPDRYAELVGATILGTVIATLIPRSLIRRQKPDDDSQLSVPMASTITLPRPGVLLLAMSTALIAALTAGTVIAQNGSSDEAALPAQIDVLVPYRGEKFTGRSSAGDVVYIDSQVLRVLQRNVLATQHNPIVLVTANRCNGVIDRSGHCSIRVTLTLAVSRGISGDIETPVPAALLDSGAPVLLDGQPVRSLPGISGETLLIPVPERNNNARDASTSSERGEPGRAPAPPLPDSSDSSNFPSSAAASFWSLHELVFQLRSDVLMTSESHRLELPVSSTANSEVRLTFETPPEDVINRATGQSLKMSVDGTCSVLPGAVERVSLEWIKEPAAKDAARLNVDIRSAADIYPGRIQRQTLARYSPVDSAPISHVAWRLPPHVRIDRQSIRVPGLVDMAVQPRSDSSLLVLEFEPPHIEPFTLQMAWQQILDGSSPEPVVLWEAPVSPQLFPSNVHVDSHIAGLSPAPGFALSDRIVDATTQSEVDIETWLNLWPDNARPRLAPVSFRVAADEGSAVPAEIVPSPVQRAVRQNLAASFQTGLVQWIVNAEIETSGVPAFSHEINVPETLRIDSVSLQQDEVDRLSHWERNGDRLLLFLRDRSTGIQNVTIEGRQLLEAQSRVVVPAINVAGAQNQATTLQVRTFHGYRSIVTGAEELDTRTEPDDSGTRSESGAGSSRSFRVIPGETASIQLEATGTEQPVRWSGFLSLSDDGQPQMELLISVSTDRTRQMTLNLPAWVADDAEILQIDGIDNVSASETVSARLDGPELHISVDAPAGQESLIRVRLPLDSSVTAEDSAVTVVNLVPPTIDELESVPAVIRAQSGTGRIEITGELISDTEREQYSPVLEATSPGDATLIWDTATQAILEPSTGKALPSLVLHSVKSGGRVSQMCRTRILLNADTAQLTVRWPASVQEIYRRVDGQLHRTQTGTTTDAAAGIAPDRTVVETINLPTQNEFHVVEFLWQPRTTGSTVRIRRETLIYPSIEADTPTQSFVEVLPAAEINILPVDRSNSDASARSDLSAIIAKWQRYADRKTTDSTSGLIAELQAVLAGDGLMTRSSADSAAAPTPAGTGNAIGRPTGQQQRPAEAHTLLLSLHRNGTVAVWLVDRRVDLVLLGLLVGLAAVAPILKFFSLEFGEQLARRPASSFVILGVVWWLCLQSSAAGFCLLLAALAWRSGQFLIRNQRQRRLKIPATQ
ncbi:MAG: hypothetical protein ACYTGL_14065 [Planctomycetota bacterium]|jgi:hypothetical protein